MPPAKPADVAAYLAALPEGSRAALVAVRAAIRRALPSSVEAIKYGMPAYLVEGRAVVSFAGWKDHYALYFVAPALFDAVRNDLPTHAASKGIVRFGLEEAVPTSVVKHLAAWGAAAGAGPKKPTKAKQAAPPTKPKGSTKRASTSARPKRSTGSEAG